MSKGRERRSPDHAGVRSVDECRRCTPQMSRHRDRSTVRSKGARRGPDVRGFRRGCWVGVSRRMQAIDANLREPDPEGTPAAGLRLIAAEPDHPCRRDPLVRWVQPDRAGRRQSRAGPAPPDAEPCDHLRRPGNEPGPGHQAETPPEAHPLPVARGAPSPTLRVGRPWQCAVFTGAAGGHHPAPVADRLSQERDRDHALAGHRRGHAQLGRRQDRSETGLPERAGPCHP